MLAAAGASLVDYAVNSGLVTIFVSLRTGVPIRQVVRELRIGRLSEFLVSYFGLGLVGLSLAILYKSVGVLGAAGNPCSPVVRSADVLPIAGARRSPQGTSGPRAGTSFALERHGRGTSRRTTPDRRVPPRRPRPGAVPALDPGRRRAQAPGEGSDGRRGVQLDKIRHSKQETSDRIRALIRDLHRSPLGAKGLAEALESFTEEVGRDSSIRFHRDVEDIELPAPIALLVYHIAREGVMNALKHAQPQGRVDRGSRGGRRHRAQPEGQRGWLRHGALRAPKVTSAWR